MITNKIKFSHFYEKLPPHVLSTKGSTYATLLGVQKITKAKLPNDFVAYDTKYKTIKQDAGFNFQDAGFNFFNLKGNEFLILFFWGADGLFTTVRPVYSRFGNKEEFYKAKVGEEFEIIIQEKN